MGKKTTSSSSATASDAAKPRRNDASTMLNALPWRPSEAHLHGEVEEMGLGMLEEIPADSYEVVTAADGTVTIVMKGETSKQDTAARTHQKGAQQQGSDVPEEEGGAEDAGVAALSKKEKKRLRQKERKLKRRREGEEEDADMEEAGDADAAAPAEDGDGDEAVPAAPAPAPAPAAAKAAKKGGVAQSSSSSGATSSSAAATTSPLHLEAMSVASTTFSKSARAKGSHGPVAKGGVSLGDAIAEWSPLGVSSRPLLRNLASLGYSKPTPVQSLAIPAALTHFKDVVGAAQTGSGKTLAYGLPIVARLLDRRARLGMDVLSHKTSSGKGVGGSSGEAAAANDDDEEDNDASTGPAAAGSGAAASNVTRKYWSCLPALIITPTRELAVQVSEHIAAIAEGTAVRVVTVVGGLAPEKQDRQLRSRPDIIVATPGRFWDLVSSGRHIYLSSLSLLQFLVLDEADRLVEKGSFQQLTSILAAAKPLDDGNAAPAGGKKGKRGGKVAAPFLDPVAEAILDQKKKEVAAAAGALKKKGGAAAAAAEEGEEENEEDEEDEEDGEENADADADADADGGSESDADAAEAVATKEGKWAPLPSSSSSSSSSSSAAAAAALNIIQPPAHYKRQTFLFSATLGVQTGQSIRDAAAALVSAQAHNAGKMGKKAIKRAQAEAAKLTPVEALMARVGLLGKPYVVRISKSSEGGDVMSASMLPSKEGADEGKDKKKKKKAKGGEGAEEEEKEEKTAASSSSSSSDSGVTLPESLRIARVTCLDVEDKDVRLYAFLRRYSGRTLIFVNAISTLKRLTALLMALRLPVHTLHAHMQQRQRLDHLERFRADPNGVLVATDVAARGLDVPSVDFVLHYALPVAAETFVHRCGRTARGNAAGLALALVGPSDAQSYTRIMNVLKMGAGLPEFPEDERVTKKLAPRVLLARRIADEQSLLDKESDAANWLTSTADRAELGVDDGAAYHMGSNLAAMAVAAERGNRKGGNRNGDGGGGKGKEEGAAGKTKKARRDADAEDDDEAEGVDADVDGDDAANKDNSNIFDVDDEDRAEARHEMKEMRQRIKKMRSALGQLLKEEAAVLPQGMSRRYVTSNPLMQGIRIEGMDGEGDSEEAEGKEGEEEEEGAAAVAIKKKTSAFSSASSSSSSSSTAITARTSGSALVAPRVFLPPEITGAKRGDLSRGSGQKDALEALASKGKHVFVPAAQQAQAQARRKLKMQQQKDKSDKYKPKK